MPQFQPYLFFPGTCAEAMKFYEKLLGAELKALIRYRDQPEFAMQGEQQHGCAGMEIPESARDLVMHAAIMFDGSLLMASDAGPGMPYDGIKGASVNINFADVARGQQVFDALAEGGKVEMPMGETFWVERFGAVTDRFGTPWMINAGRNKL